MCTSPIQLEKKQLDGSFRVYTVPCGKCPECRAKYQSEYAALSVLEANKAGSLAFITLTYDNAHLPVLVTRRYRGEIVSSDFCDTADCFVDPCGPMAYEDEFVDCVEVYGCPSLRRLDVQLCLKRYRQDYFRRHGERIDLRYSVFGEYGERYHRPHYHMIVYGLSRDEVNRLASKWSFGFANVQYVERFNSDGSDAFVKVSRYVSKYVSKCEYLPEFCQRGFAESPRKQSSVKLGRRNLNYEHMRNFI